MKEANSILHAAATHRGSSRLRSMPGCGEVAEALPGERWAGDARTVVLLHGGG